MLRRIQREGLFSELLTEMMLEKLSVTVIVLCSSSSSGSSRKERFERD